MRKVPVSEAKKNLTSILKSVEEGETAIITRRGKPVGALLGFQEFQNLRKLRAYNSVVQLSEEFSECGIAATELYQQSRSELDEGA